MTLLHTTPPSALEDLRVSLLWDILFFYQQTLLFLKCLHLLTYQLQVKTRNFLQGWLCDAGRRSRLVEQNQKPKWVYQLLVWVYFGLTCYFCYNSRKPKSLLKTCQNGDLRSKIVLDWSCPQRMGNHSIGRWYLIAIL